MRYLFEVGHPAEVHCFRQTIKNVKRAGHEVLVAAREKEITHTLLENYHIDFVPLGHNRPSRLAKAWWLLRNDLKLIRLMYRFKPDLVVSFFSPYAAHAGKLMGRTVIGFHDTEHARLAIRITRPFTDCLVVPESYTLSMKKPRLIRFKGTFELAYLHPNRFQPDPGILDTMGLDKRERFVLLRFVSHSPVHDQGMRGISDEKKVWLVNQLIPHARVFISSETPLPEPLKPFQLHIPPEKIHDALFYASLLLGESATMTSEAAVLGTPAIFWYPDELGYIRDQHSVHKIVFHYRKVPQNLEGSIQKAIRLLSDPRTPAVWRQKRDRMLKEMIDVQAFMEWFLTHYPHSREKMEQNSDFQQKFR